MPMITSYEPFSEEPEYRLANRAFVNSVPLRGTPRVLDLACGTGLVSEAVLARWPGARVVLLDLSRESLELARRRVGAALTLDGHLPGCVGFLEASADAIPLAATSVDAVIMANAIHILPDVDRLLRDVWRVLRPGGVFAFSTSFYAGTFPRGTEKLYHHWVMAALRYIRERGGGTAGEGTTVRRVRGMAPAAFSRPWLTPVQWEARLDAHAFAVANVVERPVVMTQRSLETVGAYAGLASVLFSGYPVELACAALEAAAGPAFAAAGVTAVDRLWLEVTAVKRDRSTPDGG